MRGGCGSGTNSEGETVLSVPLAIGVIGVAIALAAIGAVASLLTECTFSVDRDPE